MKAVLMSTQPKWCELIANGKKTVEVRKTKPKLETPFKVYIYCTKNKNKKIDSWLNLYCDDRKITTDIRLEEPCYKLNGKIIGEFVCDEIDTVMSVDTPCMRYFMINDKMDMFFSDASCLDVDDMGAYLGFNKIGYGWHISDLVIYDVPKPLSDFYKECAGLDNTGLCYECENAVGEECDCVVNGRLQFTRPPQSWCYVEELQTSGL